MSIYNPTKHHRRSIRLKGYDYAQAGLYFITFCCQNREMLFGKVLNGKMRLNKIGEIAHREWENTANNRKNIKLHEFIIMPNHMHGIVEILFKRGNSSKEGIGEFKSPSQTIGSIIRGYKIATIKKIKEFCWVELHFDPIREKIKRLDFKIWQRNYYEHIIRTEKSYYNISNYIINNPIKWQEDTFNK